jgi:hypothetical protein
MVKDKRYYALKSYIESEAIKSFTEIFDIVPKSVIVRDAGMNYTRLTSKIKNPDKFTVKDIVIISQLIGIDSRKLYDLIALAIEKKVGKKKG